MGLPFDDNCMVKMQIAALENSQPRALREAVLGDVAALARLKIIDMQIAALRAQLTPE